MVAHFKNNVSASLIDGVLRAEKELKTFSMVEDDRMNYQTKSQKDNDYI
jgi:hypothetical protein